MGFCKSIFSIMQAAGLSHQTTIAFGIWGGIVVLGPFVSIIKHVRSQVIVMMAVSVAFLGT